ncbi:unnamed protein product [Rhizopus stolonifer]
MSFITSVDCGQIDPRSVLLKQFHQDRSLHQDRFTLDQRGESSKTGFRSGKKPVFENKLTAEFLRQESAKPFEFNELNRELEYMQHDWTTGFMQHQESPFQDNWTSGFKSFPDVIFSQEKAMLEKALYESQADWTAEFSAQEHWIAEGQMTVNERPFKTDDMLIDSIRGNMSLCQPHGEFFNQQNALDAENRHELFNKETEAENRSEKYNESTNHSEEESSVEQRPEYKLAGPQYDTYNFSLDNGYLLYTDLIEGRQHSVLSDSILALEAKAQLQISNSNAWKMLGFKQQENEKDKEAIAALRQAVKLNPSMTDAWLALAVSYANEGCKIDAYDSLEQWILQNEKYANLARTPRKENMILEEHHTRITGMFIEAARSSPGAEMDPEVQICLGVLFNVSREYDKAVDCFRAALASKPQDYLLWNKLGATLANSKNPSSAVEAYFNALEINPDYVRARYNLAISFMHLGQHNDSAEHLLAALVLQQSTEGAVVMANKQGSNMNMSGGMSSSIWKTLRVLMLAMNRDDLVKHCDNHRIDPFREHFEF